MTRYRELRRMENAIRHQNKEELKWALGWARSRIAIATRKDHLKVWKKREKQILIVRSQIED